ncbi:MarR family winged helix-turn-helix transcriptional regulator [Lysinibacillus sp. BW-2-10]|uniref:MarR family winged helix-turn-helix transcriptional regulator n=1 Tax=Lysinibacillus sp. BW-2-10 TaxID=2590030 RepID=UPI00117F24C1|nr:MarR family transcriptional regulator [Lysinibacillus sp. BW-2-10]TSI10922.1 MarR family transcriptional regulator [Lysinibacillus sp. BW-2-10]
MEGFFQSYLRLYRLIITSLNELLSIYKLSYSLWQVIFHIKNNGPSTLVDIAKQYNVEKPTITRRVHRLEELQIVKQIVGQDRREKIIQLTELGEELYKACRKEITDLEVKIMEGITREEQEVISHILPKIQENIINKEGNKIE